MHGFTNSYSTQYKESFPVFSTEKSKEGFLFFKFKTRIYFLKSNPFTYTSWSF